MVRYNMALKSVSIYSTIRTSFLKYLAYPPSTHLCAQLRICMGSEEHLVIPPQKQICSCSFLLVEEHKTWQSTGWAG